MEAVVVLVKTEDGRGASSLPRGMFVVSNASSHDILGEEPDLVVWAVHRVLVAARGER